VTKPGLDRLTLGDKARISSELPLEREAGAASNLKAASTRYNED